MVQTLVCAQDWLRPKGEQRVDLEETLPELLELEEGNYPLYLVFINAFFSFFWELTRKTCIL